MSNRSRRNQAPESLPLPPAVAAASPKLAAIREQREAAANTGIHRAQTEKALNAILTPPKPPASAPAVRSLAARTLAAREAEQAAEASEAIATLEAADAASESDEGDDTITREELLAATAHLAPARQASTPPPAPAGRQLSTTAQYNRRMKSLGPARARAVKLKLIAARLQKHASQTTGWAVEGIAIGALLATAHKALIDITTALEALPSDWKPGVKAGADSGADSMIAGAIVAIRSKHRPAYAGLLEPAQMTGLKVEIMASGRCRCRTADGAETLILPRAHLMLAGAVDAPSTPSLPESGDAS